MPLQVPHKIWYSFGNQNWLINKLELLDGCTQQNVTTVYQTLITWLTAIVFSLIPPTGKIFPVSETSPVIATFWRTGWFNANERRAVTMVQPALGPSFGVAP